MVDELRHAFEQEELPHVILSDSEESLSPSRPSGSLRFFAIAQNDTSKPIFYGMTLSTSTDNELVTQELSGEEIEATRELAAELEAAQAEIAAGDVRDFEA